MKKIENNCTNCSWRRTRCRFGRGVVVWKDCREFKAKRNVGNQDQTTAAFIAAVMGGEKK